MKPRELYSGAAPAAMGQMGAGILEAGANIGRSIQSGYESIGKSIGAGLQAAGGAVGQYETAKNANNITRSLLSDDNLSEPILGVKGEAREKMLASFNNVVKQHGQMGAAQFSNSVLSPIHEYANTGRQYTQQQELAKLNPGFTTASAQSNYYQAQAEALGRKNAPYNPEMNLPENAGNVNFGLITPTNKGASVDMTEDSNEGIYAPSPFAKKPLKIGR